MFATIRRYVIAPSLADALAQRSPEIESVIAAVEGCSGWELIRTASGVVVVMVGSEEPVLVEAGRRFAAWGRIHVPGFAAAAVPQIWSGEVVAGSVEKESGNARPASRSTSARSRR